MGQLHPNSIRLAMHNAGSEKRGCPHCGSNKSKTLIRMSAQEIVSANWSYSQDMFADMGIAPETEFPIKKCLDCAFVYSAEIPSHDFLTFVYDRIINIEAARRESYSPHNIANRMEYLSCLLRLLGTGGKVLDYGCGFGASLALLRNIEGIETIGFDTSAARVQELSRWHLLVTQDLKRVQAQGPFNAVILDNVLEHLPDPRQTVKAIGNLCANGAILYVSVPDINRHYLDAQIALNRRSKQLAMDINPWEHLNYFDLAHLDRLMESAGFFVLRQVELPNEVRIGLRPDRNVLPRIKNTLASMFRGIRYALTGETLQTANRRFYRFNGHAVAFQPSKRRS